MDRGQLPQAPPRLRPRLPQVNGTDALEALWRDYFVVTFVRNPYQRAVSSYRMMARQLAAEGPVAPAYSWGAFCADPTGFADQCMRDDFCKTCVRRSGAGGRRRAGLRCGSCRGLWLLMCAACTCSPLPRPAPFMHTHV